MSNQFSFICICVWQFLQNQGFLVSITNENDIQVLIFTIKLVFYALSAAFPNVNQRWEA